ncbi:glutamate--cysteine ligase [Moraxella nasovis]|uniref:glutamate--cysteine ligase n=1 Tax=Moraxella nasovis TaxID=2904121 RepID=UPI001F61E317|nr:glutamate--cysteine ligase [Moraxella nasovis]UNU74203.1 glutamate--cysteine ligase [Moraxella nasovis]
MTVTNTTLPTWFTSNLVAGMQRGIEKEGLRMQPDGHSAKTFHPARLGSKLTHPFITTDYSENLLELITEPKDTIKDALDMLRQLHVLVHRSLENDEMMWPLSMPCMLSDDDEDIPLANYGTSNIGRLKTLYRSGLGVRYGRKMQTIAGLHYNLSIGDDLFSEWMKAENRTDLTEFKNEKYLSLIRNFKRLTPLVLYLLGASPSVCGCFLTGRKHDLIPLTKDSCTTFYKPYATSLRMGKLGYTNSVQEDLDIRYNELGEYIKGLRRAIDTPFADFSKIGVDDKDGQPIQINDHILQIENEFYSPIRPKQVTKSGETPTQALDKRGIAYVEFRAIDLDPYSDIGITTETACFLEILALYCLFSESPELLPDEEKRLADNVEIVVNHGRSPDATIYTTTGNTKLSTWIEERLIQMQPIADKFDEYHGGNTYRTALTLMQGKANNANLTLSAQIESDSRRLGSTWKLGQELAKKHQNELLAHAISVEDTLKFYELAVQSFAEQQRLEREETQSFDEFFRQYR